MSKKSNSVVMASHVRRQPKINQAESDLIARHQAALRAIERLDVARQLHPHVPRLANDVLRADDALDYSAPVIQVIAEKAGPIPSYGPRTGTHPMATYRPEPEYHPMATRLRPPLEDFGPTDELIGIAIQCLVIAASVMAAIALAGAV